MNKEQTDSLIRSVVKAVGPLLAAHGLQQLTTAISTDSAIETIGGIVMALMAFWASHKQHADTPPPAVTITATVPPVTNEPPKA